LDNTDILSGIQGAVTDTDMGERSYLLSLGAQTRVGGERRRKKPRIQREHTTKLSRTTTESRNKDWRLIDSEFDTLHNTFGFTLEACCDPKGLNGHANLPYCSELDSFLDRNVTGQRIFLNPPWKNAAKFVQHVRNCHAEDPINTMAIVVLPNWPCFSPITKDLALYQEIPARQSVFTRSPSYDGSVRERVSPVPWTVRYWLIDSMTPVITIRGSKEDTNGDTLVTNQDTDTDGTPDTGAVQPETIPIPVTVDTEAAAAADKYLPLAAAYTILDPDCPESLMKLPVTIDGIDTEALVDSAATLNFISGNFADQHNLKWHSAPKIAVRVASAQRIRSTRVVIPEKLIINGVNYSGIPFRILTTLTAADIILGLPALKALDMSINPASNSVTIGGGTVTCGTVPRRVECHLLDTKGLQKLVNKATRTPNCDFFLIDLKEVVAEAEIKSDFGPEFDEKLKILLNKYADVGEEFTGVPPSRGQFDHTIQLTGTPKRQRRNRLSQPEYEELKRQCIEYFAQGRVRVSNSPYAAPIILVRKPDGSMRMCIDYRGLNEYTVKDAFPIPRIDDLLDQLREAKVLTHLDLQQGYHQIRMADDGVSIPATAFQGVSPSGAPCLLEFVVMSFGLCNAPATFTKLMTHILDPYINKFVLVYLDDICIYSGNLEDHLNHIESVLLLLRKHQLKIKMKKCFWAKKETEYLGVIAGNGVLRPSPKKIEAVQNWPLPKTQKQVKSFVAFCSFYRKFIHHFSDCAAPLIEMYSGKRDKSGSVTWNDTGLVAFEALKARLISAPVLLIPVCGADAEFVVATDASDVGLGAVLLQQDDTGDLRPCAYYARKLNAAERAYSAYDKEALAVVEAITRAFRTYVDGCRSFSVVTDHATLTHLMSMPSTNLTKRQVRWVEKLMPYANYMRIVYRKGTENEADPVSRRPDFLSIWWDGDVPENNEFLLVLNATEACIDEAVVQQLLAGYAANQYFSENGRWRRDKLTRSDNGFFFYHGRLVIPRNADSLRQSLLHEYHDELGHPGWKRLLARLMTKYWWKGIMHDCKDYVAKCIVCNRAKPSRTGAAPTNPLPVPQYPWEVVGVDYVTGLPVSGKEKYTAVMIVVCHLTKMAHFIPCTDEVTAELSADLFVHHVYRLHGVPRVLVSDRDPRFISDFWQSLWRRLNTKLNMSTSRRPQTDGLTERVNETMQSLLRCVCAEAGYDWSSHLDMIEFAYNSTVGDAAKHSAFEITYGYNPPGPADLLLPNTSTTSNTVANDRLQNLHDTQAVVKELVYLSKQRMVARSDTKLPVYNPGDLVYVSTKGLRIKSQDCRKLMDRRIGPFPVIERVGGSSYRLNLPRNHRLHPVFHVDVLSKAHSDQPLRQQLEVADDNTVEHAITKILEVKLDRWPGLRGPRLLFLVQWTDVQQPAWEVYEQENTEGLEGASALDTFLQTPAWRDFSQGKAYREFAAKYPRRALLVHDD